VIVRVGIPRGLLYSRQGVAWETLCASIGAEVIVSPPTNRAILDAGCRLAVDETCLSVKSYLGHVAWLAERVDVVLVPRVVAARRRERECVKLWGIYDIVRNALPDAHVMGYSVDASGLSEEPSTPLRGLYELALGLGAAPPQAMWAVARASIAEALATRRLVAAQERLRHSARDKPRVLVVSHGYNLHDEVIGAPILRMLAQLGCEVVDSEAVPQRRARRLGKRLSPSLNWTNNLQLLGAIELWRREVDGIVFVVSFPCGPDSLVTELAQRKISGVPMVVLIVDELTGEGGVKTRLESFVDIIEMQRMRLPQTRIAEEGAV
jgi:predicted nucleotide-binding protein (sugar kinase/HSP70/actin superfamily)